MKHSRYFAMMAVAVCMVVGTAERVYAQNKNAGPEFVGTWNLDTAKSDFAKLPPPKSETLTILNSTLTAQKWMQERVDGEGKTVKMAYSGAVDDKFYALVGDPDGNTFAFMKDGSWAVKDTAGKVVETGTASVSADGKTLTLHQTFHTADGDVTTTPVFQKAS